MARQPSSGTARDSLVPSKSKAYIQNNRTNIFPVGNLWSTFNIDTQSNVGVLRISSRLKLNYSSADVDQFGIPVAIKFFDGKIFAICDTYIFQNGGTPDNTTWIADGSVSTGSQDGNFEADASDMETFNDTLCATTKTGLYSKAYIGTGAGTWTSRDTITSGTNHVVCYFKKFDRLYYADHTDYIHSISTAWVTADPGADYAIQLSSNSPPMYQVTCMRAASNFIWIGTVNTYSSGAPGKISQWDGLSAQVSSEHQLNNAQGCMAIAIDPNTDTPFAMDSNGVLSSYNGSGFVEVARLPFPFSKLPYNIADSDNEKFIHPNGMYFTKNGNLRCLINNRANVSSLGVIENLPSGIWEWIRGTNSFIHVQSFSYNPPASSTITDYGQNRVSRVGALVSMNVPSTSNIDGTLMVGATFYTNATDSKSGIFYDNSKDDVQKKGYFVSTWFESGEIASSWNGWWATFKKLGATDNIVFKYRLTEEAPVEGTITWVDTTHFTVANTVCDVSQYWTSGTGGEVEILRGVGSGQCVHITNAVLAGGTWTVTVDEVITGATTTTATARFQKWIKIFPADSLLPLSTWGSWALNTESTPRFQIKGCFTFTGVGEYHKGILISSEDISSN